ncbi:MAG: heavy-metal-associated domain-containing protein [Saprospiraceae bacterium]|nr:heavy-metal-associated domain-containing protein [Saprospiraceae bacterium]
MKKMIIFGTAILTMLFMFSLTQTSIAQDSDNDLEVVRIKAKVDCDGCKTKIEKNIAFEKGVKYVNADVKTKIVTIKYKKGKNTDKNLVAAIQKLGYGGEVVKGNAASSGCNQPCVKKSSCCSKKKTSK